MPYIFRVLQTFAGQEQGWGEAYFYQMPTNNVNDAMAYVIPLTIKRAALLADTYRLVGIRVSVYQQVGGVFIKRQAQYIEPRLNGNPNWKPAQPNVALLCKWQSGNGNFSKNMFMRGVPAGLGDAGKSPNLAFSGWLSQYNSWRSSAIALQMGWYQLATTASRQITGYTMDEATGYVTFTINAGMTWSVEPGYTQPVYISLPNKTPLDGRQIVIVPADGIHPMTAKPIGTGPFVGAGRMEIKTTSFVSLAPDGNQGATGAIHPQRMVTHKTGNPTVATRGKVSAAARW